jgi:hypothetical protein
MVDYAIRFTVLHEIHHGINGLRERHDLTPFDEGPPESARTYFGRSDRSSFLDPLKSGGRVGADADSSNQKRDYKDLSCQTSSYITTKTTASTTRSPPG